MAGSLSNDAENKILKHSVGLAAWTLPKTDKVYCALFSLAPTDDTTGTEVSGGNYDRVELTASTAWNEPVNGSMSNKADIVFPTANADWGDVEAMALFDDQKSVGGNIIWYGTFSSPRTILQGEALRFPAGSLVLSLN